MNKLIKPEKIDDIIRSGVVLKSRKAYEETRTYSISPYSLCDICSVREKSNITRFAEGVSCEDISDCKFCFLNAKNYLNVLKYIKRNKK